MLRKWIPALIVLLFCALLSGCNPIQVNIEELMRAPTLTDLQFQVQQALQDAVGSNIKLKYPKSGEYRSAFTFYDIDQNGLKEAIVLYSESETPNQTRIAILFEENGKWYSDNSRPGLGSDVDFLRFEKLQPDAGESLIVGWSLESTSEKIAAIYSYDEDGLAMDYAGSYSQIAIGDFNTDGLSELMLISSPALLSDPTAVLVGLNEKGLVDQLSEIELNRMVVSYLTPLTGAIAPGVSGVVVDGYTEAGLLCTTVLRVENDQLLLPLEQEDGSMFRQTLRHGSVASLDINGDGIIEIPVEVVPPGHENVEDDVRLYFYDYMTITEQGLERVVTAFVNSGAGYRFLFPSAWNDQPISVYRQPENGEVIFFKFETDLYNQSQELVRLRTVSLKDYQDKFETKNYFSLGKRGTFEYYARLTPDRLDGLMLSKSQVLRLFQLL